MIFAFDDFKHIFWAFFTATFQPDFYDLCNTCPEKLCMIFNKSVLKMLTGKISIIPENFIVVIISQLEISLVKNLVVFDVPEQFQIIVAVKALCDFLSV